MVKAWLSEHENEIEIFCLPSYSPELNLDKYLNCDLKGGAYIVGFQHDPRKN
ncbi:hypothetical protein ACJJIF_00865 [Microbulbifer sp. SSSA002]|uniref:hypothetical protein n=1 Tax=Microbulbifer sp. SSSA002 TaxID=3243376 RepID=UPI0040393309